MTTEYRSEFTPFESLVQPSHRRVLRAVRASVSLAGFERAPTSVCGKSAPGSAEEGRFRIEPDPLLILFPRLTASSTSDLHELGCVSVPLAEGCTAEGADEP